MSYNITCQIIGSHKELRIVTSLFYYIVKRLAESLHSIYCQQLAGPFEEEILIRLTTITRVKPSSKRKNGNLLTIELLVKSVTKGRQ